jgi:hypothetical protein
LIQAVSPDDLRSYCKDSRDKTSGAKFAPGFVSRERGWTRRQTLERVALFYTPNFGRLASIFCRAGDALEKHQTPKSAVVDQPFPVANRNAWGHAHGG